MSLRTDVSVLYVDPRGPYPKLVADWWDEERDARLYAGPNPVVAHPPCERWGRYWGGGPMLAGTTKQKKLGDDGGCFAAALAAVRKWGGVLEHPEATHAFRAHGLLAPEWGRGWQPAGDFAGFVCCVAQGNYGHRARKLTWLYAVAPVLPELDWSIPTGMARLDNGNGPGRKRATHRERIEKFERRESPLPFAELLIGLAAQAKPVARSA